MNDYDMAMAALTGLIAGALMRLANEQPIIARVGRFNPAGTIPVSFNGSEWRVTIERAP